MWVRGLKLDGIKLANIGWLSHPMWVRGLKHKLKCSYLYQCLVAPHVGAWIETQRTRAQQRNFNSRTPCGCVD